MTLRRIAFGLVAAGLLLAGCSLSEDITPPPGALALSGAPGVATGAAPSPGAGADGAAIFAQHCAPCHGAAGQGDGPMSARLMSQRTAPLPDFSAPGWQSAHSRAELLQIVTDGRLDKLMPPFKDTLSDAERRAVVSFVGTLAVGAVRASPAPAGAVSASPAAVAVAGSSLGEAAGQLSSGTQGAALAANQPIVLHGYDSFSEVEVLTTTARADGSFDFSGVPYVAGRQFMASTTYAGLNYSTDIFNFDGGAAVKGLSLTVFDTTSDPAVVRVERMHISISPRAGDGAADVAEMLLLSNTSDKVFAPPQGPVLDVPLPTRASGLTMPSQRQGLDYAAGNQSVALNTPIRPGPNAVQISFSFQMPYSGQLDFEQKLAYPVKVLNVLLATTTATAQGASLQDQGVQTSQSTTLRVYAAESLTAGAVLRFQVSGLNSGQPAGSGLAQSALSVPGLVAGLAAVVILGGAGGAWYVWRSRRAKPALAYEQLLQAMADLDIAFEAGQLQAEPYERERGRLKKIAVDIIGSGGECHGGGTTGGK